MNSIEILGTGMYLPSKEVTNKTLNDKFSLSNDWIYTRTGIKTRYEIEEESIVDLAIKSVLDLTKKNAMNVQEIDLVIVATTSTNKLMPGISFEVQKYLDIQECICIDILCGCSGYINAFDIARNYIALGEVNKALIIGAEVLSNYINKEDVNTAILLGDGAGATLIGKTNISKDYFSKIVSDGKNGEILTSSMDKKIYMNGRKIYKFGISETVKIIHKLLTKSGEKLENIKYIVPHQSNIRIMEKICENLNIGIDKMYINLANIGNTFCASIPIALNEMYEKDLIQNGDKIILLRLWRRIKFR